MDKKIGYELVIKNVRGFDDARSWIRRLISDGLVKCGQCDQPATNTFFQDQAEWYVRCESHREQGQQWTGSTRWSPSSFGINVLKDKAEEWLSNLSFNERKQFKLISFDATSYWDMLAEDYWEGKSRHYFQGAQNQDGWQIYVVLYPLNNGEFAYQLHKDWVSPNGGTGYGYGLKGAWPTEAAAIEAAKEDPDLK